MINQSLQLIKHIKFTDNSNESLVDYAYVLTCCQSAAESCGVDVIVDTCGKKIAELRNEAKRRMIKTPNSASLVLALAICGESVDITSWNDANTDNTDQLLCVVANLEANKENLSLKRKIQRWLQTANRQCIPYFQVACRFYTLYNNEHAKRILADDFNRFLSTLNYSQLTTHQLVSLHSLGHIWLQYRRDRRLEPFTRRYYRTIAQSLPQGTLSAILMLAEQFEARNQAQTLDIPYSVGIKTAELQASEIQDDQTLIARIKSLGTSPSYASREKLIIIADYIQEHITTPRHTADHLALVNAILNTSMPGFNYPDIARELEKTTLRLAKANSKTDIELAPAYHTLWLLTLKTGYLNRFQTIIRRTYAALTRSDKNRYNNPETDPQTLRAALTLLTQNRPTLHILNPNYNLTPILQKFKELG